MCNLVQKYNVAGPRYTSYPTVPYWDITEFSGKKWKDSVVKSFGESKEEGISLYLHLPFCESMCTFCGCHKRITKRHDVELPYVKALLKEWHLYLELLPERPLLKELHIGGGTPTFFSPQNLEMLLRGIFRKARVATDVEMSFEGHPNNTTTAHLQLLYGLGFKRVSYGVQDYNLRVQQAIHRVQPFENVKQVTEQARAVGYTSVGHDIIYGLPFQTLEDVKNTITKTSELRPDRIAFYSYAHVPWLKGNGQRGFKDSDLPSAALKQSQYALGKKMLTDMGYVDIGMDHFALATDALTTAAANGKLHRNFMGYTPSKTQLMIGLGASSISDSWYGFAQNVKNIEEYQDLVANNVIPVFRGHILNNEDILIRKHILNLMCRFKTAWNTEDHGVLPLQEIQERLQELAKDDLVLVDDKGITVTEKGKPFIRNISMALDLKLQRKKPDTQLFSMTV
ncbi:oxygen-independent coproporphyrinogen III oxidase [Flavobacterium sp. ASW18X]|uniref:oxygen-independent coproporphyrinogen III oxidase n=1 Tax=Flavobacterium sp. ASW18X TaxID=2572595 RepID=UPI0010AEC830|nr:oxygen-independent coproporphyrinogen III oxidase [Flavobacterium sp. ASW18X]TKD63516.1 oxygen-independent coproporphyrinogen III oxidase [Flavobacterium sp. ASW18X]